MLSPKGKLMLTCLAVSRLRTVLEYKNSALGTKEK